MYSQSNIMLKVQYMNGYLVGSRKLIRERINKLRVYLVSCFSL